MSANLTAAKYWIMGQAYERMADLANAPGFNRQHFHVPGHLVWMIDNARANAQALGINDETDKATIEVACAVHDWYQDWELGRSFDGRNIITRARKRGPNEIRSAEEVARLMHEANNLFGDPFSERHVELASLAVNATLPDWVQDKGAFKHQVVRTHFEQHGSVPEIVLAVVWADLGHIGRNPAAFREYARREYLEIAIGMWEAMANPDHVSSEEWAKLKGHCLDYFKGQSTFVAGRRQFMEEELGMIHPSGRDLATEILFEHWNHSAAIAASEYVTLSKIESPQQLAWTLGFGQMGV